MKKDYTHISILLDASSSMLHLQGDVIGGINSLLADQRKLPGKVTVSLVQFSDGPFNSRKDGYQERYVFADLNNIRDLDKTTYIPNGWTALQDSFAKLIDDTGAKLAAMPEDERPERVMFVVQTDGEENMSKKFSSDDIKARVKTQTNQFNWQFMFLGANIDAFAAASMYGIDKGNTVQFAASSKGTRGSYAGTSNLLSAKRSARVAYMSQTVYSDADRNLASDQPQPAPTP
jgi:hypothetical protein